jgi:hypothetical protein
MCLIEITSAGSSVLIDREDIVYLEDSGEDGCELGLSTAPGFYAEESCDEIAEAPCE